MAASPVGPVKLVGNALNSFGFTGENTISGLGLNTFGFLWPSADIWTPCCVAVQTSWTVCEICDEDNS